MLLDEQKFRKIYWNKYPATFIQKLKKLHAYLTHSYASTPRSAEMLNWLSLYELNKNMSKLWLIYK